MSQIIQQRSFGYYCVLGKNIFCHQGALYTLFQCMKNISGHEITDFSQNQDYNRK